MSIKYSVSNNDLSSNLKSIPHSFTNPSYVNLGLKLLVSDLNLKESIALSNNLKFIPHSFTNPSYVNLNLRYWYLT